MEKLRKTLEQVRRRIAAAQRPGAHRMTEEETKVALINPVLRALGWDVEDTEQVRFEFKAKRMDRPVDYALLLRNAPRLLVEAKAIGEDVDNRKWAGQIMSYAGVVGAPWIALTNGRDYRVYKAGVALPLGEKLFRSFSLADEPAASVLALLARAALQGSLIDAMWEEERIDRQVEKAVQDLFDPTGDLPLVSQIKKRTEGLTAGQIKASLVRARLSLEFPQAPPPSGDVTVADLIRVGLLQPPVELHKTYKGQPLQATVETSGRIRFGQELFDSPSAAGAAARATVLGGNPATNGWTFWKTQGPGGKWRSLDQLRQEYLAQGSRKP